MTMSEIDQTDLDIQEIEAVLHFLKGRRYHNINWRTAREAFDRLEGSTPEAKALARKQSNAQIAGDKR